VLLVEQNAIAAREVVSHGYLIEGGRIVMHDSASAMKKNPDIQEFYLGGRGGRDFHDIKHYRRRKRWLT
ncbi:MAG: ABC transporter ATP-binding protein, partial [Betaproteobacteria bacterium]